MIGAFLVFGRMTVGIKIDLPYVTLWVREFTGFNLEVYGLFRQQSNAVHPPLKISCEGLAGGVALVGDGILLVLSSHDVKLDNLTLENFGKKKYFGEKERGRELLLLREFI